MTRGVILFAKNNQGIDYVKQANWLAKRIRKYLDLPTTLVTDSVGYAEKFSGWDQVIKIKSQPNDNPRNFYDGTVSKQLFFKNSQRHSAYDLSPYDETILMDTDYIIANNSLLSAFNSPSDLQLYQKAYDLANYRDSKEFNYVSDSSIDFYWATVVFFRKTETNKIFFDLIQHIQENWQHYRRVYMIHSSMYRNDFAFSIAIHIMNGFMKGDVADILPGTLYYTTDRDMLLNIKDSTMTFLLQKQGKSNFLPAKTKDINVHIMNKFSLERHIDKEQANAK